jgi:2-iminobutanoate/2-iminopropanoate deaminase
MAFQVVEGPDIPVSHLPFSPAVRVGEMVFVSGQASVSPTGQIIAGTFEEEMRRSMQNVERILAAAGLGLADVARVTAYVRDESDLAEYNQIYAGLFTAPYPARTTLTGCLPASLRFEVDVIAVATAAG